MSDSNRPPSRRGFAKSLALAAAAPALAGAGIALAHLERSGYSRKELGL